MKYKRFEDIDDVIEVLQTRRNIYYLAGRARRPVLYQIIQYTVSNVNPQDSSVTLSLGAQHKPFIVNLWQDYDCFVPFND